MAADALQVRELGPLDDISTLTSLLHRAYAELAAAGFQYLATYQDDDTTRRRIDGGECYLALTGTTIVGAITFHSAGRTGGTPWYDRPDVASFSQFGVDPASRGIGIGTRLLATAERRARETGARELACDTAESATHLVALYQRRGFRIVEHVDWRPITNYRSVVLSKPIP